MSCQSFELLGKIMLMHIDETSVFFYKDTS